MQYEFNNRMGKNKSYLKQRVEKIVQRTRDRKTSIESVTLTTFDYPISDV